MGSSLAKRLRGARLPRARVEQQLRASGVAAPPEREREQLRDLNEVSRQIAPSNPVPAPGVEGRSGDAAR